MKKLALVLVVMAVGFMGFRYVTTGELGLGSGSVSAEASELRELEGRFQAAKRQFVQAARGAALGGMDMTGDAASARDELDGILTALGKLESRLVDQAERDRAEELERAVREYLATLR